MRDILAVPNATIPPHERAATEFWVYAFRYKGLVLSAVIICNLVAVLLYSFADPVYESRAGVAVGLTYRHLKVRPIEMGWDILARFESELKIPVRNSANLKLYKPISIENQGRSQFYFVVRGSDPQAIQQFSEGPLQRLLAKHKSIYASGQLALMQAFKDAQEQLDAINKNLGNLVDEERVLSEGDSGSNSQTEQLRKTMLADRAMVESSIQRLRSLHKLAPTRISHDPAVCVLVAPILTMYLFLATAIGLILGLVGAVVTARRRDGMTLSGRPG